MRRIDEYRPETQIHDVWRRFIESMGYPDEITDPLLVARRASCELLEALPGRHGPPVPRLHPHDVRADHRPRRLKINTIPDVVELEVDIRTLPGPDRRRRAGACSPRRSATWPTEVEVIAMATTTSTASPIDTPLWDTLSRVTQRFYEGSATVPYLTVGATDARFFRRTASRRTASACSASSMTLRGLRLDVPRRQRARRRRVAAACRPSSGTLVAATSTLRRPERRATMPPVIRAALFDFGGVILSSPVRGVRRVTSGSTACPRFLRTVNATNPDTNAWARLERSEVDLDEFGELFDSRVDARSATRSTATTCSALLAGELRPADGRGGPPVLRAAITGLLTNNFVAARRSRRPCRRDRWPRCWRCSTPSSSRARSACASPTRASTRSPASSSASSRPRRSSSTTSASTSSRPARMGMTTIKVTDPAVALAELEHVVGFPLR